MCIVCLLMFVCLYKSCSVTVYLHQAVCTFCQDAPSNQLIQKQWFLGLFLCDLPDGVLLSRQIATGDTVSCFGAGKIGLSITPLKFNICSSEK